MRKYGRWAIGPVNVATAFLFIASPLAAGMPSISEKPDSYDYDDTMGADWIRPADVMYIGDSESLGYFGDNIYRAVSTEHDPRTGKLLTVWTYWTCGSDVTTWLHGAVSHCGVRACNGSGRCARDHAPLDKPGNIPYGPVTRYLKGVRPRITLVSLGTNILTKRHFRKREFYNTYLAAVGQLADEIVQSGSRCIWIGPPQPALDTQPAEEYEAFMSDLGHVAQSHGCGYINSDTLSDRSLLLQRDPEGTHYRGAGEIAWAAKVWEKLEPMLKAALAG